MRKVLTEDEFERAYPMMSDELRGTIDLLKERAEKAEGTAEFLPGKLNLCQRNSQVHETERDEALAKLKTAEESSRFYQEIAESLAMATGGAKGLLHAIQGFAFQIIRHSTDEKILVWAQEILNCRDEAYKALSEAIPFPPVPKDSLLK